MFLDTTLEDEMWEIVQEAAGQLPVIVVPLDDQAVRPSQDYLSIQLLDTIPQGREEIIYDDGEGSFAIRQFYSARFSFKTFGRQSKSDLTKVLLSLYRDPYYLGLFCEKKIAPLGNPSVTDGTELLTTEFESRGASRPEFLVPVVVMSNISCIEHIDVEANWVSLEGKLIQQTQIRVDKPTGDT